LLLVFCERALPAADLEVALVLPSRSVFDAAVAALLDVASLGELRCVSALPAADFDDLLVDELDRVLEAFEAAALLVCLLARYASKQGSPNIHRKYYAGGLQRSRMGRRGCRAGHASTLMKALRDGSEPLILVSFGGWALPKVSGRLRSSRLLLEHSRENGLAAIGREIR
jgi:hypothetical protein